MDWSCTLRLLLGVILAASLGFAEKQEEESKALVDRAKQLSDLRAEGAPAFRLKTSFKVFKKGSSGTEGTYTETWISRRQWRRETVLGDFREIVVANGNKRWLLKSTSAEPKGTEEAGFQMASLRFAPEYWRPEKIEDRELGSLAARCIETKPDSTGGKSLVCFDKGTGTVAAEVLPVQVRDRIVDHTCEYRDYGKFGERLFPRVARCFEGPRPTFEETLLELSAEPSLDPALFARLEGGTEFVNCQGVSKPPTPLYMPSAVPPRIENPKNPVVLRLIVEADGTTDNLRVVGSVDKGFDDAAMEAVRHYRFKPATCDGEPVATQIDVDIKFQIISGSHLLRGPTR